MLPSNMPSAKNRDSLTHDDDLFPPRDCTYCVFIFHVCCVFTLARGKTLDTRGWCLNWHFIVFCAPCWVLDSGPFVWLSRGNRWKFIAKVCLLLLSVSTRFFFLFSKKEYLVSNHRNWFPLRLVSGVRFRIICPRSVRNLPSLNHAVNRGQKSFINGRSHCHKLLETTLPNERHLTPKSAVLIFETIVSSSAINHFLDWVCIAQITLTHSVFKDFQDRR